MLRAISSHVTVSLPYFQCKPYICKAVESILEQTHSNLTLVVVNDGDEEPPWDQLSHIYDSRLVRFDLKVNRGRYFADTIVLNATDDSYFLIQDADDWSETNRISVLLQKIREDNADAAISDYFRCKFINGEVVKTRCWAARDLDIPLRKRYEWRSQHHGLFRSASLKNIGGYYGGFGIGYDGFIMNLLLMTGRVTYTYQPLYNRNIRPDSLTNSKATGRWSLSRQIMRRRLGQLYSEAFDCYISYKNGQIDKEILCRSIRQICSKHVTQELQREIMEETIRLRGILGVLAA